MNSQTYELRHINESDYEFIYQVKKDAYKKYVEMYYGNWNEDQQKAYFEKFITTYRDGAFIITIGGKDIGFYNGSTADNKYEIGNICIIPEYQNRGIGTAILKDLLSKNFDKEVSLQYFKCNPVGTLYDRLGFKLVGETSYHYQMVKEKCDRKIEICGSLV